MDITGIEKSIQSWTPKGQPPCLGCLLNNELAVLIGASKEAEPELASHEGMNFLLQQINPLFVF